MFIQLLIAAVFFLSFNSYSVEVFNLEQINLSEINRIIEHAEPADVLPLKIEPVKSVSEWTVMVYMNGKSNIETFALRDMNRFETVGSSNKVNIVVELGRSKGLENDTSVDGDWTGIRRYLVRKDNDMEKISSPVFMQAQRDMGDYKEVIDFMNWSKSMFPAKRYALIIWDHGWGWIDPKKPDENLIDKSISHDFETGNYIKTTEIGRIFRQTGRINLYASMACFMQMAEVAFEIKDYADIIVGSEEVIQLPSFNFEDFFRILTEKPGMNAKGLGIVLVDTFKEMYSRPEYLQELEKNKYGAQLSAIRPDKLPLLANKLTEWAELAMEVSDINAMKIAKSEVLRFEVGDEITDPKKEISFYGDLYNFIEIFNKKLDISLQGALQLKQIGGEVKEIISSELVIKNVFLAKDRTGKDYSNTHGLGIHIPGKPGNLIEYEDTYQNLEFARNSNWHTFIKYLEKIN